MVFLRVGFLKRLQVPSSVIGKIGVFNTTKESGLLGLNLLTRIWHKARI